MNRRNFLAGLLATTAAVPLAKALPFTPAPVMGLDLASGPDSSAYWIMELTPTVEYTWVERGFRAGFGFYAKGKDFTRWGPEPGTVWFDEASYISDSAWEYLTGKKLDDVLAAQARGEDWRTSVSIADHACSSSCPMTKRTERAIGCLGRYPQRQHDRRHPCAERRYSCHPRGGCSSSRVHR